MTVIDCTTGEARPMTLSERVAELQARAAFVPQEVTARQMLLALAAKGKLAEVEALIEQQPLEVQIEYRRASTFDRGHPVINSLAPAIGWDQADLDELFRDAAQIG